MSSSRIRILGKASRFQRVDRALESRAKKKIGSLDALASGDKQKDPLGGIEADLIRKMNSGMRNADPSLIGTSNFGIKEVHGLA